MDQERFEALLGFRVHIASVQPEALVHSKLASAPIEVQMIMVRIARIVNITEECQKNIQELHGRKGAAARLERKMNKVIIRTARQTHAVLQEQLDRWFNHITPARG